MYPDRPTPRAIDIRDKKNAMATTSGRTSNNLDSRFASLTPKPTSPLAKTAIMTIIPQAATGIRPRRLRIALEFNTSFMPVCCHCWFTASHRYRLSAAFAIPSINRFSSCGVSFGRSMVSVILLILPVKGNGTW